MADEETIKKNLLAQHFAQAFASNATLKLKKVRKELFLGMQVDEDDKTSKKAFKTVVKSLELNGTISVDADGVIIVLTKCVEKKDKKDKKEKNEKKEKKVKKEKKEKKRKTTDDDISENDLSDKKQKADHDVDDNNNDNDNDNDDDEDEPDSYANNVENPTNPNKNLPVPGNREGITRLFIGNLPFTVSEATLQSHLPGNMTHVKWVTDKESGRFYGSAFVEIEDSAQARDCVKVAGSELEGRALKINLAPSREGDVWPPTRAESTGGKHIMTTGEQAGGSGKKAMSEKPAECKKLFIGNLSYEIDEDALFKFFDNVGSELKAVRWLSHKETGDFKGCGFAEFWDTEACDKAATLNGKNLLGRPIRIDWTE